MIGLLHGAALAGYLGATVLLGRALAAGRGMAPAAVPVLVIGGVVAHAAAFAAYTARFDEPPLVGLAPSLSTLGLAIALFLVATERLRELRPLGLVLVPIIALLAGVALALGIAPSGEALAFRGWWFVLHVVLAFLGFAGLTVAFAAGLLYLIQLRQLREKTFGRMYRFLPPLEALERVGHRALAAGFPALTIALALGWAWTVRFRNTLDLGDPKVAWAMLTWAVMAAALAFRGGGPRRQRWQAMVSVVGFAIVVIAYVVLRSAANHGRAFF